MEFWRVKMIRHPIHLHSSPSPLKLGALDSNGIDGKVQGSVSKLKGLVDEVVRLHSVPQLQSLSLCGEPWSS